MKRNDLQNKAEFLFKTFDEFFNAKVDLILGELKDTSNLNKATISELLLEVHNRSATITKYTYPCPFCHNLEDNCVACDSLVREIESYKQFANVVFKLKELHADKSINLGQSILALVALNESPIYIDKINHLFKVELFASLIEELKKELDSRLNWNQD